MSDPQERRETDKGAYRQLLQAVADTTGRVTALESEMRSVIDGQRIQNEKQDRILDKIQDRGQVNWAGWAAVAVVVIGGLWQADQRNQQFVQLYTQPMQRDIAERYDEVRAHGDDLDVISTAVAKLEAFEESYKMRESQMENWQLRQDDQLTRQQEQISRHSETLHWLKRPGAVGNQ